MWTGMDGFKCPMTGNIFLHLSRLAVGVVFIFSGFVKAIDPYGFSYKIQDYLTSFGSGFQKFNSLAFGAAIALSTFEFLIGLNLVFQIHLKRTTILAFLFMLVMLPLTLYIALFNPVTDCGCFGEALVISNWATFYKNVVLIALIILIWLFNNRFRKIFMVQSLFNNKFLKYLFVGVVHWHNRVNLHSGHS